MSRWTTIRHTAASAWALTRPYFVSEQRWVACGLLAAVVALNLAFVYLAVLFNQWNQVFYDSLQEKNSAVFWAQLWRFSYLAFAYIVIAVYKFYLTQLLEIRWRSWLTQQFLTRWLSDQAFYVMELARFGPAKGAQADNPDQRIQEDIGQFTAQTLGLAMGLLHAVVTLASFVGILWVLSGDFGFSLGGSDYTIPGFMVWMALLYCGVGSVLTHYIGRSQIALNFQQQRLEADLASLTGGQAPQDFIRVIQTIFRLKQAGEVSEAGALISWLCGSGNVAAASKKAAGIKGDIGSRDALDYLRGVLEIVKAAGYKGLLIVIDEAETILRMRSDSRHKSLNGIRQIADAAGSYPGMLWLFTGTPEFFDTRYGVAGLEPLHRRISFSKQGPYASLRQPQLELTPFDAERLRSVALRLRELYPSATRPELEERMSLDFINRLVAEVTKGFRGDVGVVPRQFLREFVNQLDLVEGNETYSPSDEYGFDPNQISRVARTPEEQQRLEGGSDSTPLDDLEEGPDLIPTPIEDVW